MLAYRSSYVTIAHFLIVQTALLIQDSPLLPVILFTAQPRSAIKLESQVEVEPMQRKEKLTVDHGYLLPAKV